jgi:hypothetical protein
VSPSRSVSRSCELPRSEGARRRARASSKQRCQSLWTDSSPVQTGAQQTLGCTTGSGMVTPPAASTRHSRCPKPAPSSFDQGVTTLGAVIAGRRTYELANARGGRGPMPALPLFIVSQRAADDVPESDPPYTFVTDGVDAAVAKARTAAAGKDRAPNGRKHRAASDPGRPARRTRPQPRTSGARGRCAAAGAPAASQARGDTSVDAPGVTHLTYRVTR